MFSKAYQLFYIYQKGIKKESHHQKFKEEIIQIFNVSRKPIKIRINNYKIIFRRKLNNQHSNGISHYI
jgi:hypothetical protein